MSKDKVHSTNYFDTFIAVAEDTKATCGTSPPTRGSNKTMAEMQYELLVSRPYQYTSDDVFFMVFAERNDIPASDFPKARSEYFSKGQPCFRSSPLTKTYGFGVLSDKDGKVAIYGMETEEYQQFMDDQNIKQLKAMRTSRKR